MLDPKNEKASLRSKTKAHTKHKEGEMKKQTTDGKIALVLVLICYALIFSSCSESNKTKDIALSYCKQHLNAKYGKENIEFKDFRIVEGEKRKLSQADKANGITEQYKWIIEFIGKRKNKNWTSWRRVIFVAKKNGKYVSKINLPIH